MQFLPQGFPAGPTAHFLRRKTHFVKNSQKKERVPGAFPAPGSSLTLFKIQIVTAYDTRSGAGHILNRTKKHIWVNETVRISTIIKVSFLARIMDHDKDDFAVQNGTSARCVSNLHGEFIGLYRQISYILRRSNHGMRPFQLRQHKFEFVFHWDYVAPLTRSWW